MVKVISIANRKGGVGKTTTAVNIATAMAAIGKRVLILDMDPQGNATTSLGINKNKCLFSTYDLMINPYLQHVGYVLQHRTRCCKRF